MSSGRSEDGDLTQLSPQVSSLLRCYICFDSSENPVLCPHCTKICCRSCMTKWLVSENKRHCPHCRHYLSLEKCVSGRFLREFTEEIEKFQKLSSERAKLITPPPSKKKSPLTSSSSDKKHDRGKKNLDDDDYISRTRSPKCVKHNLSMSYYCRTCSCEVCSDCAMFDKKHTGHEFERLDVVYEGNLKTIWAAGNVLKTRLAELKRVFNAINANICSVNRGRDAKIAELSKLMTDMKNRVDEQTKSKMVILLSQKETISNEIDLIRRVINELNVQISDSSKPALIAKTEDILEMLQKFEREDSVDDSFFVSTEFQSEIIPEYEMRSVSIPVPTQLITNQISQVTDSKVIYSSPCAINRVNWRIKVYPFGAGTAYGTYLSIFIEATSGLFEKSRYEYRIELVHPINNSLSIFREYSSVFKNGECWGYNKFVKLEQLRDLNFVHVDKSNNENVLTFRFHVRPPTYFHKSREQEAYVKYLEHKVRTMQESCDGIEIEKRKLVMSERNGRNGMKREIDERDLEAEIVGIELENDAVMATKFTKNENDQIESSVEIDDGRLKAPEEQKTRDFNDSGNSVMSVVSNFSGTSFTSSLSTDAERSFTIPKSAQIDLDDEYNLSDEDEDEDDEENEEGEIEEDEIVEERIYDEATKTDEFEKKIDFQIRKSEKTLINIENYLNMSDNKGINKN